MTARPDLQIVWHPGYAFGEPTIVGTRITPEAVASLVWAGDDLDEIAADYGITPEQVRLACWFTRRHDAYTGWDWAIEDSSRCSAWDRWADAWLRWAGGHTEDHPGSPPGRTSEGA